MNYLQVRTEVQDALARTDATITSKIGTWVNRRRRMAAARHSFGFLRTETAVAIAKDLQAYSLTGDFKDDVLFYLLKSDAYVELPIKARLEMIRTYSPADTGEPELVSLETWVTSDPPAAPILTFLVWPPKPDAAYTLQIVAYNWPVDLTQDTEVDWFTAHFPQLLIAGGTAEGFWLLGAEEQATMAERRWEVELQRAIVYDQRRDLPSEFALTPRFAVGRSSATTDRDLWRF